MTDDEKRDKRLLARKRLRRLRALAKERRLLEERERAAERNAGQRSDQQRSEQPEVDRAQMRMSEAGDERERHRVCNVAADDPDGREARI